MNRQIPCVNHQFHNAVPQRGCTIAKMLLFLASFLSCTLEYKVNLIFLYPAHRWRHHYQPANNKVLLQQIKKTSPEVTRCTCRSFNTAISFGSIWYNKIKEILIRELISYMNGFHRFCVCNRFILKFLF